MSQMNLHVKPEFERDLARLMRLRGLPTKSAAIRFAVREALGRAEHAGAGTDYTRWRGAALAGALNPEPHFESDDDLWTGDGR